MNANKNPLDTDITIERRTKILEILDKNGQLKVSELSRQFNVSEVTIRNDLAQLEQKGLLIRARGGAMRPHRVGIDIAIEMKAKKHYAEKKAIGKKAAELIAEGETIVLDSGTTTMEIAKNLGNFSNLTVVTNALNIALELAKYPQIKIIIPGGFLRENSISLVGAIAEKNISGFYCDKVFLGVDGIDSETGIYTPNIEEAHLNQIMIQNADKIIVVTDSSKFGKRSFAYIAPLSAIDIVITDKNIPEKAVKNLDNANVRIIKA